MSAVFPLCLCENTQETTSRNGSEGRLIRGCLLLYTPVSSEYQSCDMGWLSDVSKLELSVEE